jgi:diguanylate cyclase (GGDEF)-like protein
LNLTDFAIRWHDSCKARHDHEGARLALDQALDFGHRAVVTGGRQQRVRSMALAHCNLAQAQVRAKNYLAAQASFGAALALAPNDAEMVGEIKLFQAVAAREQGQADVARELLEEGLRVASETGIETIVHSLLLEYSELEQEQGRLAEAFVRYKQRHELMVAHYEKRLSATAQSVETLVEAEMARFNAAAAERREHELRTRHDELSREAERWQQAALQDPLTHTLNRRGFYQMAQRLFTPGKAPAVVLLDLDHFKRINDVHGHAVGDRVLQQLVSCVNAQCRDCDVLARFGGEEFVLLLDHDTEAQALAHAERLRQTVAEHDWDAIAPGLRVTASLGLALHAEVLSVDALLSLADAALYQAKSDGRNCVRLANYGKLAELQS